MNLADLVDFGNTGFPYRLLRGGLPPFFLAKTRVEREFQEWVDAYWAKDVLELFRLERRYSFQRFFELLMAQSGGIFEATRFAWPCEVSRTSITNYLAVLEATFVVHVVRPYSVSRASEIISAPKVYGFDTGFVCAHRGWNDLRREDLGLLWEHLALNELHGHIASRRIHYWRSKHGNEVDFVLAPHGKPPTAIECTWSADAFDSANLRAFRYRYPHGKNLVVAADVAQPFDRSYGRIRVRFVGLEGLGRLGTS